jgi:hypothetical protein
MGSIARFAALLLLFGCERGAPAGDEAVNPAAPTSVAGRGEGGRPAEPEAAAAPSSSAGDRPAQPPAGTAGAGSPANAAGDGSAAPPPAAGADGADPSAEVAPPDLEHTFPEVSIAPSEESTGVCQSWTLGNEEPLFVNRVVASNLGGFHHSNWIWVDDASYDGPDGTWPCADRGFEQILAGAVGGVFFAQSTQSQHDTQAFPAGAAFEVPAHARIIGDVHLLNVSDATIDTSLHFDVYTLAASDVRVKLQPMAFTNTALEVAAAGDTSARMQCAVPQPDFDVYYVLPHFHINGQQLRIDVAGGALDGSNVFSSRGSYGDALGQVFDPPIAVHGADALVITCDYRNPSDMVLGYGVGNQEMCVVLIYSTGAKAGGTAVTNVSVEDSGGVHRTDALCLSVGAP